MTSHNEEEVNTPRAERFQQSQDYFTNPPSPTQSTPQKGFKVTSRQVTNEPSTESIASAYKATMLQTRPAPPPQIAETVSMDDLESLHGEQGSEWGEDEAEFEWLDSDAPEAFNGVQEDKHTSPTKKLGGKIKQVVGRSNSLRQSTSNEPRKLRKNLVFPRRAPPPPPVDVEPAPPPPHLSPNPAISPNPSISPNPQSRPFPSRHEDSVFSTSRNPRPPAPSRGWTETSAKTFNGNNLFIPTNRENRHQPTPRPVMVPMKTEPLSSSMAKSGSQSISHMSMQSAAYSFYDLDSPGPSTPRAATPTGGSVQRFDTEVPSGRYAKVSVSRLEREARERSLSDPHGRSSSRQSVEEEPVSPEGLLAKGIEERGKGDYPKSAWYFMRAAESGSATGRMYWGK